MQSGIPARCGLRKACEDGSEHSDASLSGQGIAGLHHRNDERFCGQESFQSSVKFGKVKKTPLESGVFLSPAYKNVACVSIRDLDIFGNDGAMSSFLRIEMFINFQVNDNLYQAHQCGYCGDNSGRVYPENENSQREYAVDEQKHDNQSDIVSFGTDESHGNGRIAADDSGYPGKSRNKERETQNDEHKDRQKPCKIRRYEQSQIGQTKPFVKFGKGFEGAGKEKQNFETDFKREQRCKGQQQNRQHSNQCVAETAPAEKRLPSEIKQTKK